MARALQAFINERHVGQLRDQNGVWDFAYTPDWRAFPEAFALSPALRMQDVPIVDASSVRPVQWYFDNLLPEEGARQLLAKDARVDVEDAFGLLSIYGSESAGSLTLVTEMLENEAGTRALSEDQLQARIEKLPRVPLMHDAAKRMSLAGAQQKLPVVVRDNALFEPIGRTPSTHILKPDHPDPDYPHSVINEYFSMRLAGALRLDAPSVTRRYVPAPVYLIERFDRLHRGDSVERTHVIDACQALNLDRQFKYRAGSIDRLRQLADQCTAPAAARLKLFGWFVFNLIVANGDAHLKNISFLVDSRGIRVAPFYDVLAVGVYGTPAFGKQEWPHMPLTFPFSGRNTFQELDSGAVIEAGVALGLRADTARRILQDQVRRIDAAARRLLEEIERENATLIAARPSLAATFAGEMRLIRAIVTITIRDMVMKLQQSAAGSTLHAS